MTGQELYDSVVKQITEAIEKDKDESVKMRKNFRLIDAIKDEKWYNIPIDKRDGKVRRFINEHCVSGGKQDIFPGQLIMFKYFTPLLRDELKYYDAKPCTIFFGMFQTDSGPRVIGFNLHYYPPKMRYLILDKIFNMFREEYLRSWEKGMSKEISNMTYKRLISRLRQYDLTFGVREYAPELIRGIIPIPPMYWSKAVLSEGHFKKETREQIMSYWRKWIEKHSK